MTTLHIDAPRFRARIGIYTCALHAGKNIRWVSDQLGHADPAFTLRTYAHLMPEEESNLSFAEFGVGVNEKRVAIGAPKRPYTAPTEIEPFEEPPNPLIQMARREGFDASLRS